MLYVHREERGSRRPQHEHHLEHKPQPVVPQHAAPNKLPFIGRHGVGNTNRYGKRQTSGRNPSQQAGVLAALKQIHHQNRRGNQQNKDFRQNRQHISSVNATHLGTSRHKFGTPAGHQSRASKCIAALLITPKIHIGQTPIHSISTISGAMTTISRTDISVRCPTHLVLSGPWSTCFSPLRM